VSQGGKEQDVKTGHDTQPAKELHNSDARIADKSLTVIPKHDKNKNVKKTFLKIVAFKQREYRCMCASLFITISIIMNYVFH
jgi:hypothetical protein